MNDWILSYNKLPQGLPNVIWELKGEENLYLVVCAPYLRSPEITFSMVRCPPGQERDPRAVNTVIFLEDATSQEFERMFHGNHPNFSLPHDLHEKYGLVMQVQKEFINKYVN